MLRVDETYGVVTPIHGSMNHKTIWSKLVVTIDVPDSIRPRRHVLAAFYRGVSTESLPDTIDPRDRGQQPVTLNIPTQL